MSGIFTFLAGGVLGSGGAGPVTANLTFMIDMNNPSSWPGYGNTIYNIAANANNNTNMNYITYTGTTNFFQVVDDPTSGGAVQIGSTGNSSAGKYLTTWSGSSGGSPLGTGSNNWTLELWTRWAGNVQLSATGALGNRLAIFGEKYGNPDQVGYSITMEDATSNGPGGSSLTGNTVKNATYNGAYNYTNANAAQYRPYPGQWYHIVATQTPVNATHTTNQLYINGNLADDAVYTNWQASGLEFRLGQILSQDSELIGTSNIAVAVARTYNRGLGAAEVSRNYNLDRTRFVGGSLSFAGANSYANVAGNQFYMTTGNYTVEFWANSAASDLAPRFVFGYGNSANAQQVTALSFTGDGAGSANLTYTAANSVVFNNVSVPAVNTWKHYAISRSGTTTNLYVNGALVSSNVSDTSNLNANYTMALGTSGARTDSETFNGGLTNFRITKQSLYTADFSPPTAPYNSDNVANCTLSLLATDNVAKHTDSSPQATPVVVTGVGNIAWSNNTPYSQVGNLVTFGYTGAIQQWTVPAGITSVDVAVVGAAGSFSVNNGTESTPGGGAAIIGNLTVTPGETLYLVVGGQPLKSSTPSYGGGGAGGLAGNTSRSGGAGGGLSGIFTSSTPSQANALIIAAGGGGVGQYQNFSTFDGGNAGASNAQFVEYGNTVRFFGSRGQENDSGSYGYNGAAGGMLNMPISGATYQAANNLIYFTYATPTGNGKYPVYAVGDYPTDRIMDIQSGTSVGTTYTVNYTAAGSTSNIVLIPGQTIRITGANNANYNGNWTVATAGTNTFTFTGTVSSGGSANAQGDVFSQWTPYVLDVSGCDNPNFNGTWSVFDGNTLGFRVFSYQSGNPGTFTGSNGVVSSRGTWGNVYDTATTWPQPGAALAGGNGAGTGATGYGGGGGGAGYWGGGGGSSGGVATGSGGGGASYWQNPRMANVYFIGTNDVVGNATVNSGNGHILISY